MWRAAFLLLGLVAVRGGPAVRLVDLTHAKVATLSADHPASSARVLLLDLVRDRLGWGWGASAAAETSGASPTVALVLREQDNGSADAFELAVHGGSVMVWASGPLGFNAGVRRLVREARLYSDGRVLLPENLSLRRSSADARWPMRGHQYTAAHYPSMFRSFEGFDQYTKAQQVFGTNVVELAHFDRPTTDPPIDITGLQLYSQHLDSLDVNVSLYWSCGIANMSYTALAFEAMPRIDEIFFPGGDGGALDWPEMVKYVKELHKRHPAATVWVSAQELDASDLAQFVRNISRADVAEWLTGIVYGPHVRVPLIQFVDMIPKNYLVRQYPDLCHLVDAQYALYAWHYAWAFTHSRQVINPMPQLEAGIVRLRSNGSTPTIGVGAYSEGVNDDFNKALWSGMGEDSSLTVTDVLHQYSRFHFGAENEASGVAGLAGLERNFDGAPDLVTINQTLSHWDTIVGSMNRSSFEANWRVQMYSHRAVYDLFVGLMLRDEMAQEKSAYDALKQAGSVGSLQAIATAQKTLARNVTSPEAQLARHRLETLVAVMNRSIGLEVVQGQDTSLNMATIDTPLSDGPFLTLRLADIRKEKNEATRLKMISDLVRWGKPAEGSFYDFLGGISPEDHPHLVVGEGVSTDPSCYYTANQAQDGRNTARRLSWNRFAEVLFDGHLVMRYTGLNRSSPYTLRVAYYVKDGDHASGGTRLVANGGKFMIHDYQPAPSPIQVVRYELPLNVTDSGALEIECYEEPGLGGSGRTCDICEMWLDPA